MLFSSFWRNLVICIYDLGFMSPLSKNEEDDIWNDKCIIVLYQSNVKKPESIYTSHQIQFPLNFWHPLKLQLVNPVLRILEVEFAMQNFIQQFSHLRTALYFLPWKKTYYTLKSFKGVNQIRILKAPLVY